MPAALTIVGGYLGSGKTTLLNGLLESAPTTRFGVVVNDFGSINLDSRLVRSRNGNVAELTNGCVCCQIQDDAATILAALAERADLEHVVVELSGVADPASLLGWQHFPGFSPGGLIVCVDAVNTLVWLSDVYLRDTIERQLAQADVFVLTKVDLASDEQIAEVTRRCLAVSPTARLLSSRGGDVGLPLLLNGARAGGLGIDRAGEHAQHISLTVTSIGNVDISALRGFFSRLPEGVVRAKGTVRAADDPSAITVVQHVGRETQISLDSRQGQEAVNHITIIGVRERVVAAEWNDMARALAAVMGSNSVTTKKNGPVV